MCLSHDTLENLAVTDKKYFEDENSSSLEVEIENKGLTPLRDITVGVVLSDIEGNVIGFSKTFMDGINPKSKDIAPFTWPLNRKGAVVTIEALPVVEPVRD